MSGINTRLGKITICKETTEYDPQGYVLIKATVPNIHDNTTFVSITMNYEDFSKALTGLRDQNCRITIRTI